LPGARRVGFGQEPTLLVPGTGTVPEIPVTQYRPKEDKMSNVSWGIKKISGFGSKACSCCDNFVNEQEKFCRRCGHNLNMQCPSCQEELVNELHNPLQFCYNCGVNLQAIAEQVDALSKPGGDQVVIVKVTVKEVELEVQANRIVSQAK